MLGLILVGYAFDILLLVLGSLSFIIGLFILLILIIGFGIRLGLGIFKVFRDFYVRTRSN
jgi:hypothetical protein